MTKLMKIMTTNFLLLHSKARKRPSTHPMMKILVLRRPINQLIRPVNREICSFTMAVWATRWQEQTRGEDE